MRRAMRYCELVTCVAMLRTPHRVTIEGEDGREALCSVESEAAFLGPHIELSVWLTSTANMSAEA